MFGRMMELPIIRNRLETAAKAPLSDVDRRRLAALVFLHDIGKLHPGFQAKGWLAGSWSGPVRGHSKESLGVPHARLETARAPVPRNDAADHGMGAKRSARSSRR